MAIVTISLKHQIVIPSEVRKRLGLKPKQRLIVLEKGGIISLVPDEPLTKLRGSLRGSMGAAEDEHVGQKGQDRIFQG